MKKNHCSRNPFGTIRLPADAFEYVDTIVDEKGRTLKRLRIKGASEDIPLLTEVPFELYDIKEIKIQPMKIPTASIFYLDYTYGKKKDE